MVVRRFLKRVIVIQRHFREFLACKRARILLLSRLFETCELQYINVSTSLMYVISQKDRGKQSRVQNIIVEQSEVSKFDTEIFFNIVALISLNVISSVSLIIDNQ